MLVICSVLLRFVFEIRSVGLILTSRLCRLDNVLVLALSSVHPSLPCF